jgi:hypothetical protein
MPLGTHSFRWLWCILPNLHEVFNLTIYTVLLLMSSSYGKKLGLQRKLHIDTTTRKYKTKGLRWKPRCSPCIFQVVVSLSIRDFLIIATTYTDKDRLGLQRQ